MAHCKAARFLLKSLGKGLSRVVTSRQTRRLLINHARCRCFALPQTGHRTQSTETRVSHPLGVRLGNILNFLSDEDVDRCVGFEEHYKEIGYYLNWLWGGGQDGAAA